jgi:hypothetical protein
MKRNVPTAVEISIVVVWVVTPCSLVCVYQRFGGTYRLLHPSVLKMEAICSFETLINTYETARRQNPDDHYRLLSHNLTGRTELIHEKA